MVRCLSSLLLTALYLTTSLLLLEAFSMTTKYLISKNPCPVEPKIKGVSVAKICEEYLGCVWDKKDQACYQPVDNPIETAHCGRMAHELVLGGHRALEWPSDVQLEPTFYLDELPISIQCEGTLIAPDLVLTAAHCFTLPFSFADKTTIILKTNKTTVLFGQIERGKPQKTQKSTVVVVHEGNTIHESAEYDIALVKLDTPWVLDAHPCLPKFRNRVTEGTNCTSVGFGILIKDKKSGDGVFPTVLQQLDVTIRNATEPICNLAAGRICAADVAANGGLCMGDSGGPLYCKRSKSPSSRSLVKRVYVDGVLSSGNHYCYGHHNDYANFYISTAKFRYWIQKSYERLRNKN